VTIRRSAWKRAEHHEVDFGCGRIPVLTVEDVILAKRYAINRSVSRPKDLDDLQSIAEAEHEIDGKYIRFRMEEMGGRSRRQRKTPAGNSDRNRFVNTLNTCQPAARARGQDVSALWVNPRSSSREAPPAADMTPMS